MTNVNTPSHLNGSRERLELIPQKMQVLSGSALKVIAVLSMLLDHIAIVFVSPDGPVWFSALGQQITLYWCMRVIGRMAFPIFAFLIVEGVRHTHDRVRYGINLFVFALVSELPWDRLFYGSWFTMRKQNVFFTLFLGYLAICLFEKLRGRFWLQASSLIALFVVASFLRADYGNKGFCFILMVYALYEYRIFQALLTGAGLLSSTWFPALAYIPLMLYNGKRGFIKGKVLKYAFYAFYPAHMLVLYLIKTLR